MQFCNNDNCEEFFKNNKELNKHIKYHCTHQHKEHRTITNGIYDRRKLNNAGDPNEDELLHGGGVHYSATDKIWKCTGCNFTAGNYNSNAVRIHRIKHVKDRINFERANNNNTTGILLKPDEINCRIALLSLNDETKNELSTWHNPPHNPNEHNPIILNKPNIANENDPNQHHFQLMGM